MGEIVPIVGGLMAGFAIGYRVDGRRARLSSLTAASVVIGVFAAWVSGELAESAAFLAIDIPGTFLAAAVAVFTVDRLGARAAGQRPPT